MWWANLTPFMPVLVLITRVIDRPTLHFALARNTVYKSNTREKTWQVESFEHIEQYHMKSVEISNYLKRRGRWSVRRVVIFTGHNLHQRVTVSCTLSLKFWSPCSFQRKWTFISPSSLAWGKFLLFCTCTR